MASMVLTDCYVKIGAEEYSGANTNVAISYSAAAEDITTMGETTRVNIGGLKEWSMSFEFVADEATTGEFFALVGETVPVEVRASSAPRGSSNPAYVGNAVVTEYTPLSGSVGDAHKVSLSVVSAGPLDRLTTL